VKDVERVGSRAGYQDGCPGISKVEWGLARFRAIPGDEERGDHVPRGDGESGSQYIRIFLELDSAVLVFI